MGDGRVTSKSPDEVGNNKQFNPTSFSYKKFFEEAFPEYLVAGMTYEQFWKDDPELVVFYRKAYRLRQKEINYNLWLAGFYIYQVACEVSPLYSWKPSKPEPYLDAPIPLTSEEAREQEEARAKRHSEIMQAKALAFAEAFNEKFKNENKDETEIDNEVADNG